MPAPQLPRLRPRLPSLPPTFPLPPSRSSRSIAGIGALPYYLRRLMYGEYPRAKDDFEKMGKFQREWDAGAPYASTAVARADAGRAALEAKWAAQWKALQ